MLHTFRDRARKTMLGRRYTPRNADKTKLRFRRRSSAALIPLRGAGRGPARDRPGGLSYSSFTTTTVTSAVTSLCNRTGTLYSPNCLIGSPTWVFRRSVGEVLGGRGA